MTPDTRTPAPRPPRDDAIAVLVLEPDPPRRAELARLLAGDAVDVVAVGSPVAARAALMRTGARLLVAGPGVDAGTAGGLAAPVGHDGRPCCVVHVTDEAAGPRRSVDHVVPVADAPAALTAWARALVSISVPVGLGTDRLTGAVAAAPDALVLIDRLPGFPATGAGAFRVAGLNTEAERLLGVTASDVIGRRLAGLPGKAAAVLSDACARSAERGLPAEVECALDDRWYACRALPSADGITISIRDCTDRRRREIRREGLFALTHTAARAPDLASVLQEAADVLADVLGADLAAVGRIGGEEVEVLVVNRGANMALAGPPAPAASGLAAAARTGRPVRVRFGTTTAEIPHDGAAVEEVGVPVTVDGAVWGAILVAAPAVQADAEAFLQEVASEVATAVRRDTRRSELEAQAVTDPLTGLANRRAFEARLDRELARAHRHGRSLALAVVDLDHFKAVNDRHGHAEGDAVLCEVAARLVAEARGTDMVARIGGEEFAWLMPETEGLSAWQAVDRARRRIAAAPIGRAGRVTVSAGVCDAGRAGDARRLFLRADDALYWAKGNGRDVVFLYAEDTATALARARQGARPVTDEELRRLRSEGA